MSQRDGERQRDTQTDRDTDRHTGRECFAYKYVLQCNPVTQKTNIKTVFVLEKTFVHKRHIVVLVIYVFLLFM